MSATVFHHRNPSLKKIDTNVYFDTKTGNTIFYEYRALTKSQCMNRVEEQKVYKGKLLTVYYYDMIISAYQMKVSHDNGLNFTFEW